MAVINPWGKAGWVFDRIGNKRWASLISTSFEPRCRGLVDWLIERNISDKYYCVDIKPQNNRFYENIKSLKESHKNYFELVLPGLVEFYEQDLLEELSVWNDLATDIARSHPSIIVDMSTLPKRVSLFVIKKLMISNDVKDLVVCYTKAESYKEGKLTEDALPPAALPGFARLSADSEDSVVVVSVGYMSYNLSEYLEQSQVKHVKHMFPFPPGSPSFRRNWRLLHKLSPSNVPDKFDDIKRIHAMDMFAALHWLRGVRESSLTFRNLNIEMIPLGPKTHALAMALAYLDDEEKSEVIYSQPQLYHPDYSSGIAVDHSGEKEIYAYCLKVDGQRQV